MLGRACHVYAVRLRRVAELALLGINSVAEGLGWDISNYRIVHAAGDDKAPAAAVALARSNEVAALMKGQVHTDALMGAIIDRNLGLRTGRRLSHIFHMTIPERDRVLMITDGAVNVIPNTDTLIHITQNAVDLAHALGNSNPKVALLSGTESIIESMPSYPGIVMSSSRFHD